MLPEMSPPPEMMVTQSENMARGGRRNLDSNRCVSCGNHLFLAEIEMTSYEDGDDKHDEAKSPMNHRQQPSGWPVKSPTTMGESEKVVEIRWRLYRACD